MKKILLICALGTTSTLLLAGWFNSSNRTNKNNNTVQGATVNRIKTDSGLEYVIMQEGSGDSPKKGQTVVVHYTGWLDNNGQPGTKFDSSVDRNQPFSFKIGVGQVILGWDEGVISMKIGEKRRLFIPSNLGYGSRGAGRLIPGDAALIFDVELIEII